MPERGPRFVHIDDRNGRAVIMLPGAPFIYLSGAMVREIVRAYDRSRRRLARKRNLP